MKVIYCLDINKYFRSATEASVHTGVCRTSIIKTCRNKRATAGGMLWCYGSEADKFKEYYKSVSCV